MELLPILSLTAMISTIGQFLSGMLTVRKIKEQGSSGDLSVVPFLSAVVGCSCWLFYGVLLGDNTITYVNVIGAILNSFYVYIFFMYTLKRSLISRQMLGAVTFLTLMLYYITQSEDASVIRSHVGIVCVVITLGCCASPLIALNTVIKTKSTETLPFPLILSMFIVCFQWWMYGLLISDIFMQFTNLCGTIIAFAQLCLFVIYPSTSYNSMAKL